MQEIGKRGNLPLADEQFKRIEVSPGRPTNLPKLGDNEYVVGGMVITDLWEKLFLCDNGLADMQTLYDAYHRGGANELLWYKALVFFSAGQAPEIPAK